MALAFAYFYIAICTCTVNINVAWAYVRQSELLSENQTVTCNFDRTLNLDVSNITVHFSDIKNNYNTTYLINDAPSIVNYENWDPTRPLVVFVAGFTSNIEGITAEWIREAFTTLPEVYFIVIDYSPYTSKLTVQSLEKAIPYAYYIGKALGVFLVGLNTKGYPSENIHLIGHSFGAHIIGYAGETYEELTSEKVWRLTGIDPAKSCFHVAEIEDKISAGKAQYVEVYHCTQNYGTTNTVADADFFYNNVTGTQPGCYDDIYIRTIGRTVAEECGHIYCVKFWSDTVVHTDWYKAYSSNGDCISSSDDVIAGYSNTGNARGIFNASTEISERN